MYFHTLCVRTANDLARLPGCAGSPEPSLVAYVISTIISHELAQTVLSLRIPWCLQDSYDLHYSITCDCVHRLFTLFPDRMECERSGNEMLV